MSGITPTLDLFVDNEQTPYYWLDVTLPSPSDYDTDSHQSVPAGPYTNDILQLDVNLTSPHTGTFTIQILLGEIDIDEEDGEIHIDLKDENQTSVGGGVVRVENATEGSRPIIAFKP